MRTPVGARVEQARTRALTSSAVSTSAGSFRPLPDRGTTSSPWGVVVPVVLVDAFVVVLAAAFGGGLTLWAKSVSPWSPPGPVQQEREHPGPRTLRGRLRRVVLTA